MKEHVTLAVAHELFREARDFVSGRKAYMPLESKIRKISYAVFQKSNTTVLLTVCNEIFYVLACEAKGVER